jgi:hypothetical protein
VQPPRPLRKIKPGKIHGRKTPDAEISAPGVVFSKDWKPEPVVFPSIGKSHGNFSKAWKNPREKFRALDSGSGLGGA